MKKLFTTAQKCNMSFTMAEILISLTIIGIIAAITLPALRNNINETTWNTQRKALYSRISQAIALMPSLNGYGIGATNTETADKAAMAFVTDGLSKVLKINNICDNSNINKCGFPNKIKTYNDETINTPLNFYSMYSFNSPVGRSYINTKAAAFETANGESAIVYYNPNCGYFSKDKFNYGHLDTDDNHILPALCVNLVFDMNGKKGPNKVGKDISYMTVLSPTDSVIATAGLYGKRAFRTYENAVQYCKSLGSEYRLPTIYELAAMYANIRLILYNNNSYSTRFWSSTKDDSNLAWALYPKFGHIRRIETSLTFSVQCIRR